MHSDTGKYQSTGLRPWKTDINKAPNNQILLHE